MYTRSNAGMALVVAATFVASAGCRAEQKETAVTEVSVDPRTAVPLPADGHQAVLREMRDLLSAVGGAMAGAASGDTAAVLAAIAPAGSAAAADPHLEEMLPAGWKELAERLHGGFDSLAVAVRQARGASALKDTVLVRLSALNAHCTACHEMFRATVQ